MNLDKLRDLGIACTLFALLAHSCSFTKDATDDPQAVWVTRSGLTLYTDHGTGCQYVAGLFGFVITPRTGPDHKQMGCRQPLNPDVPQSH